MNEIMESLPIDVPVVLDAATPGGGGMTTTGLFRDGQVGDVAVPVEAATATVTGNTAHGNSLAPSLNSGNTFNINMPFAGAFSGNKTESKPTTDSLLARFSSESDTLVVNNESQVQNSGLGNAGLG
ncbi:MAG: hypothetical protein LBC86_05180 [Oscillospiraceae bacterium]|jgi:hypothetical protein|nr:hypothetical protein [Oscillospiraceae bacterium]